MAIGAGGGMEAGNSDFLVNPVDVLCGKGLRLLMGVYFGESCCKFIPCRKWHLDSRRCMGLEFWRSLLLLEVELMETLVKPCGFY